MKKKREQHEWRWIRDAMQSAISVHVKDIKHAFRGNRDEIEFLTNMSVLAILASCPWSPLSS